MRNAKCELRTADLTKNRNMKSLASNPLPRGLIGSKKLECRRGER